MAEHAVNVPAPAPVPVRFRIRARTRTRARRSPSVPTRAMFPSFRSPDAAGGLISTRNY